MADASAILYIAAQLPKRSETFVYRELLALRATGQQVLAASVHPPERGLGAQPLDALADEAIGVYGPGMARLLGDAALEKIAHPVRAIGTFCRAVADALQADDVCGVDRMKIIGQSVAALALAHRIRALPVRVAHLHAHMAHVPTTVAMYAAQQLGVPFSFTGHAADLFRDRSLLRAKLRRASFVACISAWHRTFYRKLVERPEGDYPVIRCAVDTTEFQPRAPDPAAPPLLLGVGRLVPKKGFDLLIEALAVLRDRGTGFRAVIGGEGPEADALRALRDRLGLADRVELPGALSNDRVRQLMADATLFALPCRIDARGDQDGIPVVLMEAMACGVPCVSGDLPAIRELIADGRSGRLIPPGDVPALAAALQQLLADSAARTHMGTAGRHHIEMEFATTVNTVRLQNAFRRALTT